MQTFGFGALVGGLITAPMIALMYFAQKWQDLSFAPFDVFDWIARALPGPLVTFGIDMMIEILIALGASVAGTAKTAEQAMAIMLFFAGGIVATIVMFGLLRRYGNRRKEAFGLIAGALVGIPIAYITASMGQSSVNAVVNFVWVFLLFITWGNLVSYSAPRLLSGFAPARESDDPEAERSVEVLDRRRFLIRMGLATATITVAGAGIGRSLAIADRNQAQADLAALSVPEPGMPMPPSMIDLPNEDDPLKPALGTRPEYTAVRDHYKVFIRSQPTRIEEVDWTLPITGLVSNPLELTLREIRDKYEPRSEFVTLSCISNRVGGDLISTTYWTGASLQDILRDVRPTDDARYLFIRSGDGFYETVDLDMIESDERIMLAYAWDGRPIPQDHGFPLRIWLPDRYGMKQPKWITEIEVIGDYKQGYWVERGWDEVAAVKTTSVVDTIAIDSVVEEDGQKRVPIGGIAHSGDKRISRVEVRVDREEWQEARLRSPLSDTTWVIWRYDWPFVEGNHSFEVRTYEDDGTPQIEERATSRPSGATGYHQKAETLYLPDDADA